MLLADLPYPLRLCVEMMHYSVWLCPKTQDKKASEVQAMLLQFFDAADIDRAVAMLKNGENTVA